MILPPSRQTLPIAVLQNKKMRGSCAIRHSSPALFFGDTLLYYVRSRKVKGANL